MHKAFFKTCIVLFTIVQSARAQDSTLLNMLEDSLTTASGPSVASSTFKATQIINQQTVEAPGKNNLQFLIMHRFGRINEGAYALFGLDNAAIRFGLDYGLTNRLAVGIGRSSDQKVFDASFKLKLLKQTAGKTPVSVSLFEQVTHTTLRQPEKNFLTARFRTAYASQLLIARKFNSNLSLQVTPSWVHFNLVPSPQDKNDIVTLGIGGRMKVTKRISINAEYNYLPPNQVVTDTVHSSLSLGFDIETGGHVFQFVFSNSIGMTAPYFLTKTYGEWGKGDVYFGFNISRAFSFKKKTDSGSKW